MQYLVVLDFCIASTYIFEIEPHLENTEDIDEVFSYLNEKYKHVDLNLKESNCQWMYSDNDRVKLM